MAQKTAVQCLIDELKSGKNLQFVMTKCGHLITVHDNMLDKILQMEKEQAFQSFKAGQDSMEEGGKNFEQYYEKYNGNKLDKKRD